MNGIDSILAVLTLIVILILVPLKQYADYNGELKRYALKEITEEKDGDPLWVKRAGEILGLETGYVRIGFEGGKNRIFLPYVFKDYDPENIMGKGGLVCYGY